MVSHTGIQTGKHRHRHIPKDKPSSGQTDYFKQHIPHRQRHDHPHKVNQRNETAYQSAM